MSLENAGYTLMLPGRLGVTMEQGLALSCHAALFVLIKNNLRVSVSLYNVHNELQHLKCLAGHWCS